MKPGRNDPCPCGSGKKFKKCCVDTWSVRERELGFAPASDRPVRHPGPQLYVRAAASDDATLLEGLTPAERALIAENRGDHWSCAQVAALSTEALVDALRGHGVDWDENAFRKSAESRWSAWSLSDEWIAAAAPRTARDEHFLGLVACELWRRLMPDRPSLEMIEDEVQRGYDLHDRGEIVHAADVWWQVWVTVHGRMTPTMWTMESTWPIFDGATTFGEWCEHLVVCLWQASLRDDRFVELGRRFGEQWMVQFAGEAEEHQVSFLRMLAGFVARHGDAALAEAILVSLIERYPKNTVAYVALADLYRHVFESSVPKDLSRARGWLEKALAVADRAAGDRERIEKRLAELDAQIAGEVRPH